MTRSSRMATSVCHRRLGASFRYDNFGRDIFSRVIWGTRVDLQIAVIGVVFPFMIGTVVGTLAGYLGGKVDTVFMRVIDHLWPSPFWC